MSDYRDAIKKSEGFSPSAKWDYKQNSNGYGTRARFPGETIDPAEAERRFHEEIAKARALVDQTAPDAPEGVKNALTSLTYNAGGDWTKAGLGAAVQAGDYAGAKDRFLQYTKAGGETLPGLVDRRQSEAAWFDLPPEANRQGSINGGRGMSPTGFAGVAGPIQTSEAGHGIPQGFADTAPLPGQTSTAPPWSQDETRDFNDPQMGDALGTFGDALGKYLQKMTPNPPPVQMAHATRPNVSFATVAQLLAKRAKPGNHGSGGRGLT